MAMRVEKISAVTFRVADMALSVRFYRDVLGMELLLGGEGAGFCSLRIKDVQSVILNLELGRTVTRWGRLIFYVADGGCILGVPLRKAISSGEAARRLVNDTSTCQIQTATSYRSRSR
jgi:catechol 2,3-dioxygenase-like lactoylglutathione lyase family enzyme